MIKGKIPAILIYGAPGSGKGTQAVLLEKLFPLKQFSTGDIFRSIPKTSTLWKSLDKDYISKGMLVPDEKTVEIFKHYIEASIKMFKFDPEQEYALLDGIPRTTEQLSIIQRFMDIKAVIVLEKVDNNILIERIIERGKRQNRTDDTDRNIINNRLNIYYETTQKLLKEIDDKQIIRVDGNLEKHAVLHHICEELKSYLL
ncbi:nucleoside monophosphate kinase [Chlamydiia bacterium]|jgi:adenylate kinase|nr:nucleoside monophosphate kinase [Chlamydiia bacterium]